MGLFSPRRALSSLFGLLAIGAIAACAAEPGSVAASPDGGGGAPEGDEELAPGECSARTSDCNEDPSDGCETNIGTDAENCGACGTRCKAPTNGSASCKKGVCSATCKAGYRLDGTACVADDEPPLSCGGDKVDCDGVCRSVSDDPLHCGGCNKACPIPSGGSALCNSGVCAAICPIGSALEGTACVAVPPGSITAAIAIGSDFTCGLTGQGAVKCWGLNSSGQIGNGTITANGAASTTKSPSDVIGLGGGLQQIATGGSTACAVTSTGGVKCWGSNTYGQIGQGTTSLPKTAPVDVVSLGAPVSRIALGTWHACALTTGGAVKCWGRNNDGQLGNGSTQDSAAPVAVTGLSSGVVAIAAGGLATCAITNAGAVKCWGSNSSGTTGSGSAAVRITVPTNVTGLSSGAVAIGVGSLHACALLTGGGIKCWGYNAQGQLGDGTKTDRTTPVDVLSLPGAMDALSTNNNNTCARRGTTAYCWGANNEGQLGDGKAVTQASLPLAVANLTGVTAIVAGGHSCAATTGGFRCWGRNTQGQLGNGTTTPALTPIAVTF
jgi:hypothetical protein